MKKFLVLLLALGVLQGADSERLTLIRQRLEEGAAQGRMAGAVALVGRGGRVLSLDAAGYRDVGKRLPMLTDTIVQVMSQTKSFTAVAAMMLMEEGKLDLLRPVADYLPEYRGQMVEEKAADGTLSRHAPKHPPTVAELLSHSSGLPFLPGTGRYARINFTMDATLAEAVRAYGAEPLTAEPGTRYLYSNMGIATVGRIVEVLSGEEFTAFVQRRVLEPLGMRDTFFVPPQAKRDRIAMVYLRKDGQFVPAGDLAQGGDPARFRAGAKYAGPELALFSTAGDLFRFYQMMANHGEFGGRRYLSRQAVEAMTHDHTPNHTGYGLGFSISAGPQSLLHLLSPGTFGHGGAFGTAAWVDPANGLVMIFLTQMMGGAAEPTRAAVVQIAESSIE